jgi:hypothetical protein
VSSPMSQEDVVSKRAAGAHTIDARRGGERRRAHAGERKLTKWAFYAHLWLGVLFTVVLLAISITGILLNHKRALGLMPEVENASTAPLAASLSIDALAETALRAAGDTGAVTAIDRMDVRPRDNIVKVRLRDAASTEVTLDLSTGQVLDMGRRGDVFLEKLHSGEIFGDGWVLLSDAAAIALTIVLISGYWLWLAPRRPR